MGLEILKSYKNSKDIQENKIKLVYIALLTLDMKVVYLLYQMKEE